MKESENLENKTAGESSGQMSEVEAVTFLLTELSKLDPETRGRVIRAVAFFFGIAQIETSQSVGRRSGLAPSVSMGEGTFSEDRSIAPKQFMLEKQPKTDVEKVACLAYYLTHYRDTPHLKTLDISKLNTEAAQAKFSNAAVTVDNATKQNYLVPATKGNKQLSALGEKFVQALPDREKARAIMAEARPRRKSRKSKQQSAEE